MIFLKNEKDIRILRELAARVAEIAAKDVQEERCKMWRAHNAFERVRPPVVIRGGYEDELVEPELICEDLFFRGHEARLRSKILQDSFDDDFIIEPWLTLRARCVLPPDGLWGVSATVKRAERHGLAYHVYAALESYDDMKKMKVPSHVIDEAATAEDAERLHGAVGDIIAIHVDRGPEWKGWNADISTNLGYLRGHEQMLYDMMDNPSELHALVSFMRDGILKAQREAEAAGDWTLGEHENQSVAYEKSLADPAPGAESVTRRELWGFFSAQEFASVSPELHEEFLLRYQMPIMENFGLTAYGCCEDLTNKIDMLRKIKNLRRISVTPFADAKRCAGQIRGDYICSYRPNPNIMAVEFDAEAIGKLLRADMGEFAANGCFVDICLKDVSTVGGDVGRLVKFAELARSIAEEYEAR